MNFDFTPYFKKYEALCRMADDAFDRVKAEFPNCVTCSQGCDDCCHAMFDLTLIESLYLNHRFHEHYNGPEIDELLEIANRSDREAHQIKRRLYQGFKDGKEPAVLLREAAEQRVRCPLLGDDRRCLLYRHRPITCRLYGVPTAINGEAHTCGQTRFEQGKPYPTANLDAIHAELIALSEALVKDIKSKFTGLGEMVVPLSMALLTKYDAEYLGIEQPEDKGDAND